jgi:uncharacterized membrane protein
MSPLATTLTAICAVGAATAAGTFFDFSTFAMRGLRRLSPSHGAAAMQEINREAPTPLFMTVLFGTGAAFLALGAYAALNLDQVEAPLQLVASALYLVGVVVLTVAYHVPRNNKLDRLDPNSAAGKAYWATYLREWVRMNHVRTLAPLAAAVLLTVSLASAG